MKVRGETITREDFTRVAEGSPLEPGQSPEAATHMLLDDLVRRAAMLEAGKDLGVAGSPAVSALTRRNEEQALVKALMSQVAPPEQGVSEAEARALFASRGIEHEVQVIQSARRIEIDSALARVRRGVPFEEVARDYSRAGRVPPDGVMGFFAGGSLPSPLDAAMQSQAIGETGGPFEMSDGWFLLRVRSRRPREAGDWESQREAMFGLARQRKQRTAFDHAYRQMRRSHALQLNDPAISVLWYAMQPVGTYVPNAAEREAPLATWEGGRLTLQDAIDLLQDAERTRPPSSSSDLVTLWVEQQAMTRIFLAEARRRHLHEEPGLRTALEAKREQAILEGVFDVAMESLPPAGPELLQMAWEQVKDRFSRLRSAEVTVVATTDSALAARLAEQANGGAPLDQAAAAAGLRAERASLRFPNPDPHWASLEPMLAGMPEGACFGPEMGPAGWTLTQLRARTQEQSSLADLRPEVRAQLEQMAMQLASDQRFRQFTDSLITAYRPIPVDRNLKKLKWPMPAR